MRLPQLRALPPAASGEAMKRFQMERPLMMKRWRIEWEKHGGTFANCHCGSGAGTMRKHRPYESHPSSTCRICAIERLFARIDRRRERYAARRIIQDGCADAERDAERCFP
jgi:hypothetical protein